MTQNQDEVNLALCLIETDEQIGYQQAGKTLRDAITIRDARIAELEQALRDMIENASYRYPHFEMGENSEAGRALIKARQVLSNNG